MQEVVNENPTVQIMSFNNKMSLYIPRLYRNPIHKLVQAKTGERNNSEEAVIGNLREFVKDYFTRAKFGEIERVDIHKIKSKTGETFFRAFVHFVEWEENDLTNQVQEAIRESSSYKWWIYGVDEEHDLYNAFWILAENKSPKKKEDKTAAERLKELEEDYNKKLALMEERYLAEKARLEKKAEEEKPDKEEQDEEEQDEAAAEEK